MFRFIRRLIFLNLVLIGAAKLAQRVLPDIRDEEGDSFDLASVFEESAFSNTSKALERGTVTTLYGSTEVDLANAALAEEEVTLSVRTAFGMTTVRVPETWHVVLDNIVVMARAENMTSTDGPTGTTLRVTGCTFAGMLTVKN
jgi:predicted membrane protein